MGAKGAKSQEKARKKKKKKIGRSADTSVPAASPRACIGVQRVARPMPGGKAQKREWGWLRNLSSAIKGKASAGRRCRGRVIHLGPPQERGRVKDQKRGTMHLLRPAFIIGLSVVRPGRTETI